MPARPSSRMPSCLQQLGDSSSPAPLETVADLRKYLIEVPDPRARRGIRHPWTALLAAAAAAVLSGAASITAIVRSVFITQFAYGSRQASKPSPSSK